MRTQKEKKRGDSQNEKGRDRVLIGGEADRKEEDRKEKGRRRMAYLTSTMR